MTYTQTVRLGFQQRAAGHDQHAVRVPRLGVNYDPSTNHGYCADLNGNSPCAGAVGYTYAIENRIAYTGGSNGSMRYSYAPGNKRVWRGTGQNTSCPSTNANTDEITFWASNT